jgi:hypothetical protein
MDILVVSVGTVRGPEHDSVFSAKSIYGLSTVALISETWVEFDPTFGKILGQAPSQLDLVLCNDNVAATILRSSMPADPETPLPKVVATGTGVKVFRCTEKPEACRARLEIPAGRRVALLLGSWGNAPGVISSSEAMLNLVRGFEEAVELESVHILIRPHPSDPNQEALKQSIEELGLKKISWSWADKGTITMDNVLQVTEKVVSLDSTETLRAGRAGAFAASGREMSYAKAIERLRIPVLDSSEAIRTFLLSPASFASETFETDPLVVGKEMLKALIERARE